MTRDTIKGFDGIRALAVGAVLITHLPIIFGLVKHGLPQALVPMMHGATGVQAFFVLSGFLITTLLLRERERTGTVSLRGFILRRTLRIFPVYILFLLVATLLHVFGRNVTTWESMAYAWAYVYNFVPRDAYTNFMGHTWSLAVEEHFYLMWPTVFLLMAARRRLLMVLLLAFIAAAPALRSALSGFDARFFVERWSFIGGYPIAIGCAVALLVQQDRWRALFARREAAWIGIVLFANSLVLSADPFGMDDLAGSGYLRAFGVALLIAWVYGNQESFAVRALEVRPLKYLGAISYGVYMYQGLFISSGPWRDPASSWPPPQWAGLLMLIVVAPLSFWFFEKPFLALKGRVRRLGLAEGAAAGDRKTRRIEVDPGAMQGVLEELATRVRLRVTAFQPPWWAFWRAAGVVIEGPAGAVEDAALAIQAIEKKEYEAGIW